MKKIRLTIMAIAGIISCSCTQGQQNNQNNNTHKENKAIPLAGTKDGFAADYSDGGIPGANKYLNDHFVYPEKARELIQNDGNAPTGRIWVEFVVDVDGEIRNVKTKPVIHYSITEEVERVMKEMPKWNPGTLGGKPTVCNMALRLTLDPNKSAPTPVMEENSGDINPAQKDREAYELEETSKEPYAKVAVAEYQQQVSKEKKEGCVIDVSLAITRRQLGDRIVWREKFLEKYPRSPVSSKVNNEILSLMDVLIFSRTLDNSPTYEPQGQRIMVAEVRKGFEELIKVYPESTYMQILKKYYEMAKANGFRYNREKDFDFRYKYDLPAMN